MMTSISSELLRINKMEYLDSLPYVDLAFWLIHTFTPDRYRAGNRDVVYYACKLFYDRASSSELAVEFYERLWGMHGLKPDKAEFMHENVIQFRRAR